MSVPFVNGVLFRGEGTEGDACSSRREAVLLLSGIASALTGLASPFVVRSLGMTSTEAADPELVGPLHGVRCDWSRMSLRVVDWWGCSCSVVGGGNCLFFAWFVKRYTVLVV